MYYKTYKCLPNAYIHKEFILMNASQTQYRICGNNNNNTEYSVDKNYCKEKCVKNCHEIYYSLELEDNTYSAQNDSKIRIEYKMSEEFHYKSDKKYSFVGFMSNIGGIVGLWFGMSFIDTSALIRLMLNIIIRRLKILYLRLIKLPRLKKLTKIIIKFVRKTLNYNLRRIVSLLTIPIICTQIIILIYNYLQYPTETSIQVIGYNDIYNNNRIRIESIPAITLCIENNFEDILNNPYIKQYYIDNIFKINNFKLCASRNSLYKIKIN